MSKVADEKAYKRRIIDDVVETYLQASGAICIEGPKWCGKTWTSSYHAHSEFLVGDSSKTFPIGNLPNWTRRWFSKATRRG